MTPERWAVIKEVFTDAIAHDPSDRALFVATRCGQDVALREDVDRLLASNAADASFIEKSPLRGLAADVASRGRFSGLSRGHYRLDRRVATGGMGEVYEAIDVRTGQRVAIKVVADDGAREDERLKREAKHASELNHPNICEVYEVAEDEAGAYIAMEFLEGTNLLDALPPEGLDSSRSLQLVLQLAEAIEHAHTRNIVHRDLKSANIMLSADGHLKVLDFGLARRLPLEVESAVSAASMTEAGIIAGTLSYLAPEVLKGERADSRSDVWACGIILHELLTGRQPFEGHTAFELTSEILREPSPTLPSRVPAGLRTVRDNCLAKDPAERYQNGSELLSALRAYQSGLRVRHRAKRRTSGTLKAAVVLMTVSIAAALIWLVTLRRHAAVGQPMVSLAVLPFLDASSEAGQGYFGDGVTEALIDRLGTIETLRVFSRESVMRFRNEASLAAIKHGLSANAVVRGSVERAGGRVRLTAELLDTSTERRLWHDVYERPANEILALENDVVRAVADRLDISLAQRQLTALRVARVVDPVVYEAYLKGRFQWNKRTGGSLEQAVAFFSSAIERDPTYAPAHAALADCYNQLGTVLVGSGSPVDMRPRAKAEAIAALQIDESLAEAHATLAYVSHYDWDWATADREFRRALELHPNLALAHAWYSNYLVSRGRFNDAVLEVRRAEELDPFSLVVVTNVGWTMSHARRSQEAIAAYRRALALDSIYIQARMRLGDELANTGQFDEAIREHRQVVEMTRRSPSSLGRLANSYAAAGRRGEATAILAELLDLSRRAYVSPVNLYLTYFLLGDNDNGFVWLERAFQERSNGIVYITNARALDNVRTDARYERMLERIGLPNER